jgi:hypothetical protein
MPKYKINASQTQIAEYEIEVIAKNKTEAEKKALTTDINKWCDYDVFNSDSLSVDSVEKV